jgi:hypothetical protein
MTHINEIEGIGGRRETHKKDPKITMIQIGIDREKKPEKQVALNQPVN